MPIEMPFPSQEDLDAGRLPPKKKVKPAVAKVVTPKPADASTGYTTRTVQAETVKEEEEKKTSSAKASSFTRRA